jgi:hypothetical protein
LTTSKLNFVDEKKGSFLHIAVGRNIEHVLDHPVVVEWLLKCPRFHERNAVVTVPRYPNLPGARLRETALHWALSRGEYSHACMLMNDARFARENVNAVMRWVNRDDPMCKGGVENVFMPMDPIAVAVEGFYDQENPRPLEERTAAVRSIVFHEDFDPLPLLQALAGSFCFENVNHAPEPLPLFASAISAYFPDEPISEISRRFILRSFETLDPETTWSWWSMVREKFLEFVGFGKFKFVYVDVGASNVHSFNPAFAAELRVHDSADIVICILRFCELQTNIGFARKVFQFLPDYLQKAIVMESPWWRRYDVADEEAVTKFWTGWLKDTKTVTVY